VQRERPRRRLSELPIRGHAGNPWFQCDFAQTSDRRRK